MPSVVKHSYLRGSQMKAKAVAHINYILYRTDEHKRSERTRESENKPDVTDKVLSEEEKSERKKFEKEPQKEKKEKTRAEKYKPEKEEFKRDRVKTERDRAAARPMHSATKDNYSPTLLKKDIAKLGRNDVVHKLILSPGHNDVNAKVFVREVMGELGQAKGQELNYVFVIHENTEHKHAHVFLLGRDLDNRQVKIDKLDHLRIRVLGDRFLEREHNIERVFTREMEEFCRTRNLNPMFENERGQEFYDRLFKGDKKKDRNATMEQLEWEKFNSDWKKFIELKEGTEARPSLGTSSFHPLGRISDFTALINNNVKREIWEEVAANEPDMKEVAAEQLAMLEAHRGFLKGLIDTKTRAGDPFQALENIANKLNEEGKAFQTLMKNGMSPLYSHTGIDLNQVDAKDKITWESITYTKYDTLELLKDVKGDVREKPDGEISKEDAVKLWTWVGTKERYGNDCYGDVPRRDLVRQIDATDGPVWSKPKDVIDLDKVEAADKFKIEEQVYTKYDPMKDLVDVQLREANSGRLSQEDSDKLSVWIDTRSAHGDDIYGLPPTKSAFEIDLKNIDLSRVDGEDKIQVEDRIYTKFDSIDDLTRAQYTELENGLISESDFAKLSNWIDHKDNFGQDCFGVPPLISPGPPIDLERVDGEDKLTIGDHVYTKFDSIDDLNFAQQTAPESGLISEDDFAKLSDWVDHKNNFGENCFGVPPLLNQGPTIDLERVDAEDKIEIGTHVYTKFDSMDDLQYAQRTEPETGLITAEDFAKLSNWIDLKNYFGDDCFGEPPTKNMDIEIDRAIEGLDAHSPAQVREEIHESDLSTLDDFIGLGEGKIINYEFDFGGHVEDPLADWSELDAFIANEEPADKQLNELSGDYAIFEAPYYYEGEPIERDDGSDLFSMGIY